MKEYKDCRNPVLPPNYHIPDPEAHVMPDGRVYVYGSWDQFDDDTFCSKEYRVLSSADMVNWTDHGVSFDAGRVPWLLDDNKVQYPKVDFDWENPTPMQKEIIERHLKKEDSGQEESGIKKTSINLSSDLLYAPDAIHRNGRYYLYFCAQDDSEGVAVADKPEGPFRNPVRLPCGGIDPAVFIDDDGQAYYYWGQFRASRAKLNGNMTEIAEDSVVHRIVTEEEHGFHEGSSLRKRNGLYYFVYACIKRGKPTSLGYSTSESPLGPFTYRGIIIDNVGCDPKSWNNHGSIEEVNGRWYVFYHRSSRNGSNRRRLCIEPISFSDDGSIPEVPMTSQGAGRPFSQGETIDAYRACQLEGSLYIAPTKNGSEGLTGIGEGDSVTFRYVKWKNAVESVSVSATGSGEIWVYIGDSIPMGHIEVKDGTLISYSISAPAGTYEIKLDFRKPDNFELHSLCFN